MQWDGTAWNQAPGLSPADGGYLLGVAATSARNAWAVGAYTATGTGISTTLIEHCFRALRYRWPGV